jgi:hypothetical protein
VTYFEKKKIRSQKWLFFIWKYEIRNTKVKNNNNKIFHILVLGSHWLPLNAWTNCNWKNDCTWLHRIKPFEHSAFGWKGEKLVYILSVIVCCLYGYRYELEQNCRGRFSTCVGCGERGELLLFSSLFVPPI